MLNVSQRILNLFVSYHNYSYLRHIIISQMFHKWDSRTSAGEALVITVMLSTWNKKQKYKFFKLPEQMFDSHWGRLTPLIQSQKLQDSLPIVDKLSSMGILFWLPDFQPNLVQLLDYWPNL